MRINFNSALNYLVNPFTPSKSDLAKITEKNSFFFSPASKSPPISMQPKAGSSTAKAVAIQTLNIPLADETISEEGEANYKEITQRIRTKAKGEKYLTQDQLKEQVDALPCVSPLFLKGVEQADFSLIAKVENYPLHALKAVKQGKLSKEDFASIMILWSSKDKHKVCIKLFYRNGQGDLIPNPKARELIEQTLISERGTFLSKDEVDQFFERMKTASPFQQQFFLEKQKSPEVLADLVISGTTVTTKTPTIRQRIFNAYKGLNIFSQVKYRHMFHPFGEPKTMIPSIVMQQALLDVKFKEDALKLEFSIGASPVKRMKEQQKKGIRDCGFAFPGVYFPNTADGFPAPETDYAYHDGCFHGIIASSVPKDDREKFLQLADAIESAEIEDEPKMIDSTSPGEVELSETCIGKTLSNQKPITLYGNQKKHQMQWSAYFVDMEISNYYRLCYGKSEEKRTPAIIPAEVQETPTAMNEEPSLFLTNMYLHIQDLEDPSLPIYSPLNDNNKKSIALKVRESLFQEYAEQEDLKKLIFKCKRELKVIEEKIENLTSLLKDLSTSDDWDLRAKLQVELHFYQRAFNSEEKGISFLEMML
jgi:hypothetical protein